MEKYDIRIKILEKSGRTLQNLLQTADPKKDKSCHRTDCVVCNTDGQKGKCMYQDSRYTMSCICKAVYNGKTSRSAYIRGNEHIRDLENEDDRSDLWNHCKEKHDGTKMKFNMIVAETFKNDALLKQVSEAVWIRNTDESIRINTKMENQITINN